MTAKKFGSIHEKLSINIFRHSGFQSECCMLCRREEESRNGHPSAPPVIDGHTPVALVPIEQVQQQEAKDGSPGRSTKPAQDTQGLYIV